LAEALKQCQDDKNVAEVAFEQSKKDLEKLQKTHDDDLRLIENLRKDHDKSSKTTKISRLTMLIPQRTSAIKNKKIVILKKHWLTNMKLPRRFLTFVTN
jgi:hypothetical protein